MAINADKPSRWKDDIRASVDLFNSWFLMFAPRAFRDARSEVTKQVEFGLKATGDLAALTPAVLRTAPAVLPTLRMATCPPIARDRLVGLTGVKKSIIQRLESGKLPRTADAEQLDMALSRIIDTIVRLLDHDILPWIQAGTTATDVERYRAATIIADRLCGAAANPIVRNAQERRQFEVIRQYLQGSGYEECSPEAGVSLDGMRPGTFCFRLNVRTQRVNIPVDVVIQPRCSDAGPIPILIEAKSAGDFTNTNKRRKEEAIKVQQLKETYGEQTRFVLFLCGYFDSGYLGYEAAEGIDWVWEHRIEDLTQIGV